MHACACSLLVAVSSLCVERLGAIPVPRTVADCRGHCRGQSKTAADTVTRCRGQRERTQQRKQADTVQRNEHTTTHTHTVTHSHSTELTRQVMSLNSEEKGTGQQQAPRLAAGGAGYAAWRPHMDVFLQRSGAEGIHAKEMTEARWKEISDKAAAWAQESLDAALSLLLDAEPIDLAAVKAEPLSEQTKAARKLVTALVERSRKTYGVIYSALPEELRAQVAHIAAGFAYGLWRWLETKFQSTEQDSVGELLAEWTTLKQDDAESFDAYRARVNRLNTLLEQAKEKPSARMYAYILLDRLQPRYKAAVLALKAGGQLRDAANIAWDAVTALLNAHERDDNRMEMTAAGYEAQPLAMAARAWGNSRGTATGPAPGRAAASEEDDRDDHYLPLAEMQCWVCEEYGHLARRCPRRKKQTPGAAPGGAARPAESGGSREQVSATLHADRAETAQDKETPRSWNSVFAVRHSYTAAASGTKTGERSATTAGSGRGECTEQLARSTPVASVRNKYRVSQAAIQRTAAAATSRPTATARQRGSGLVVIAATSEHGNEPATEARGDVSMLTETATRSEGQDYFALARGDSDVKTGNTGRSAHNAQMHA